MERKREGYRTGARRRRSGDSHPRRLKRIRRAYNFSGKSVVVGGGWRGLGLVLARGLAVEGAPITLIARDEDELRKAAGDIHDRQLAADVLIVPADVG